MTVKKTDADMIAENICVVGFDMKQQHFILHVRTDEKRLEALLIGDVQVVANCHRMLQDAVKFALRPYAKAIASLKIIRDCSTDRHASDEAKDFLDSIKAVGGAGDL